MGKRILIVDDSDTVRQVAAIALRGAGYEVVEARDGRDALSKLNGTKVHLIISDVNMPNMDGIAFLKELRGSASHKFMPVIMLTTESGKDRMAEGRAAGARAWIVKPFQPALMLDAVAKLVLA